MQRGRLGKANPARNALHLHNAGPFPFTPPDTRAPSGAAAFTRYLTPWTEPPYFAPAGEVVIFALATKTEITLPRLQLKLFSQMDLRLRATPPCCLRCLANQRLR